MKKSIKRLLVAGSSFLLAAPLLVTPVTTNAASSKKSVAATNNKRLSNYATKMLTTNKVGLSGQAKKTPIFSRSMYKTTGAASGYSDFLLGLKGNGYKFTTTQRNLVQKNLVINKKSTAADLANAIVAVSAVGFKPTSYKVYGKYNTNLVSRLYQQNMTKQTVNVASQALIALSSNSFSRPKNAKFTKASLTNQIVKDQQKNGGWSYNNQVATTDSDTTSMAMIALARSKYTTAHVKKSMTNGLGFLKGSIATNGAFGYVFNGKTTLNANSTAESIIALSTKKATSKYVAKAKLNSKQKRTPLTAMYSYVNKTGSIKGAASQLLGVGQVNLAVAAYKQALKSKSVYNLK
ncbi:fucose-binding lectin II [Lentilactobacillus sp. Marseille-Q4993]|uniref:fucose-binding lectin II n=1 Tax=Lentilactobacillus sp. Marseille-Q4993 TaxID=3039492 RepID=UPI0024BD4239|nr:fucose-binding lectin II [Lentilactobacillus sp. Marseille-Q4993]